jgi:Anti-sigma factor NepR
MKALKSVRPESVGRMPVRPGFTEQKPLRLEATMQTDAHIRKAGGRLSREDQRRLGDILQRVYDDVIRQGVPDRFKDLLSELDGPQGTKGGGGAETPSAHGQSENGQSENGQGEGSRERDPVVGAKALEHPHNKGSN